MSKLRNMLVEERAEISRQVMPLVSDITRLREALSMKQAELEKWKAELEKINNAIKAVDETEARPHISIMDAVLEVLKDRPDGMTALEILAEINTRYFGGRIVRTSLSPQLSRLKDRDGKIELRGSRWFALPAEPTLFTPNE